MPVLAPVVHLDPDSHLDQLAADVRRGLGGSPKRLLPKYLYDGRGSALFDEITRQPEYYPTRAERALLERHADDVAAASGARTLVELGSGTSEKTRLLLDALRRAGTLERFVPFDVDPVVLGEAAAALDAELPGVEVAPVVGDFERHLPLLGVHPRRLVAFLGSTVGNLEADVRAAFLADVRATLHDGDALLLGVDLVKDVDRLLAAYDDAAGVTAAFERNVLTVLNRELGGDLDEAAFRYEARWDAAEERVEMLLVATRDVSARYDAIGLDVAFAAGEELLVETSAKFRRAGVEAQLGAAHLRLTTWWTDGDVALALAVPD